MDPVAYSNVFLSDAFKSLKETSQVKTTKVNFTHYHVSEIPAVGEDRMTFKYKDTD